MTMQQNLPPRDADVKHGVRQDLGDPLNYETLVIRTLAADLAVMTERAVNAEADRDSYRLLAQTALGVTARLTKINERQTQRIRQLLTTERPARKAAA